MKYLLIIFLSLGFSFILNVPSEYPSIQLGIDSSINGDTILVASGNYIENINFNGKSILLIGEDSETTIIDGNGTDTVVKIISSEDSTTVLSGFTITNGHVYSGYSNGNTNFKGGGHRY